MFNFGKKSLEQLATCHSDLQLIAKEAIKYSHVDFAINQGYRSPEEQKIAYDKGWSKIDGINKKGKHNYSPSMAFDVYVYVPGKKELAYDKTHLAYVGGVLVSTAKRLLAEGRITHEVRYGGDWDMDGQLLYDHTLQDLPHIELKF